jgi:hypothetical protein
MRLTVWCAVAATLTLGCRCLLGYKELCGHIIHGLDMLNIAESEHFVRLDNHGANGGGSACIIELHQGQIWAEAGSSGRGLRVVFEIAGARAPSTRGKRVAGAQPTALVLA